MINYLKVLRAGINSTFQDLGRFGCQHNGIVASGCMDRYLYSISNKLVNNKINEGALEFAYQGPMLELNGGPVLAAVSGKVNFKIICKNGKSRQGTPNESFVLSDGDKIDIISTIDSVYGYFSIYGGFKLLDVNKSVSTLVRAKIGPNKGDKLNSEEKIFLNVSHTSKKIKKISYDRDESCLIRVMKGFQFDYFSNASKKNFFIEEYMVTKLTDRMGMRLAGKKIENVVSKNIKSEGITKGSIQVPGDGQPIILLSDHPTIGGYPKIANIITADYDKLVQKTPGSKIKFKLVDLAIAESAFKDYIEKIKNF